MSVLNIAKRSGNASLRKQLPPWAMVERTKWTGFNLYKGRIHIISALTFFFFLFHEVTPSAVGVAFLHFHFFCAGYRISLVFATVVAAMHL